MIGKASKSNNFSLQFDIKKAFDKLHFESGMKNRPFDNYGLYFHLRLELFFCERKIPFDLAEE